MARIPETIDAVHRYASAYPLGVRQQRRDFNGTARTDPWRWGELTPARREGLHPLEGLHQELDRVFEDFWRTTPRSTFGREAWPFGEAAPRIAESEDEEAIHVRAELPGLDEKDVEVTFSDGYLTIRGEKKEETEKQERTWHRRECTYGAFHRTVPSPAPVDEDKISASFHKGTLTIDLPKAEEARRKPKRIAPICPCAGGSGRR